MRIRIKISRKIKTLFQQLCCNCKQSIFQTLIHTSFMTSLSLTISNHAWNDPAMIFLNVIQQMEILCLIIQDGYVYKLAINEYVKSIKYRGHPHELF